MNRKQMVSSFVNKVNEKIRNHENWNDVSCFQETFINLPRQSWEYDIKGDVTKLFSEIEYYISMDVLELSDCDILYQRACLDVNGREVFYTQLETTPDGCVSYWHNDLEFNIITNEQLIELMNAFKREAFKLIDWKDE